MKKEDKEKELYIESLYLEMYPSLYSYANAKLRDPEMAKEAVQNVFVIALRKYDNLRESVNPQGWLMVALRYLLSNEEKNQIKESKYIVSNPNDYQEPIEKMEKLDIMYGDLVAKDDYYLLKRVSVDQFTIRETARELGISISACEKRIQRAKNRMKKALENI